MRIMQLFLIVKMFDVEGTRGMRMAGTRNLEARIQSRVILQRKNKDLALQKKKKKKHVCPSCSVLAG